VPTPSKMPSPENSPPKFQVKARKGSVFAVTDAMLAAPPSLKDAARDVKATLHALPAPYVPRLCACAGLVACIHPVRLCRRAGNALVHRLAPRGSSIAGLEGVTLLEARRFAKKVWPPAA
jgi:hypothetical protein